MPVAELRRELGTVALTIYGVGVIVGAGIYVLIGEIVGAVGTAAWLVFVGAAVAALPTALSYAELASRYPESAGEAVFAARAFGRDEIAFLVGFLVVASGIVSVAAVTHGFADYLAQIVGDLGPFRIAVFVAFLAVLSAINARGIREATWFNVVCTLLAVAGLIAVVIAGASRWGEVAPAIVTIPTSVSVGAMLGSIALAFYAFIGFEDICNVAEETREPSRAIPRAILIALAIATALYALVAITAVAVVPTDVLAASSAPLATVGAHLWPTLWPGWLAIVALLAVTNTALFNLIMASRVLYGMARRGFLPAALAHVDPRRRTPLRAVALAFALAVLFAATGMLGVLARATNVLLLFAFAAVNLALVVVRVRKVPPDVPGDRVFRVPLFVPVLGIAVTLVLLWQLPLAAYARAAAVLAIGAVLHLLARRRSAAAGRPGAFRRA